jgi:probable addiction module antidote protein
MMEITPYDPAIFLKTDEDISHYLNEVYEDADSQVFIIALGDVAKIRGVAKVAKQANLNRESLYKVFSGQSKPQWSTIQKVMKALDVHINPVCHVHP